MRAVRKIRKGIYKRQQQDEKEQRGGDPLKVLVLGSFESREYGGLNTEEPPKQQKRNRRTFPPSLYGGRWARSVTYRASRPVASKKGDQRSPYFYKYKCKGFKGGKTEIGLTT